MPPAGRTVRHGTAARLLAAPPLGTAAPATAAEPGRITFAMPRYALRPATDRSTLTTVRAGRTVLANVFLPTGTWRDVTNGKAVRGPVTRKGHPAPLGTPPAGVSLKAEGATKAYQALARTGAER
ncbi:hypothetical protein OG889_02045 [Streptomyces sp. NBC_00481]|uniref:hypothetical protein n=1 Tax=unclassified Streptomyces TaxID=2593676 RepID=UPI002DD9ED60|nr:MULTISPECIES: hypothetical protein [unclassified Streptomyces]WRY93602.1 hypothetical protein OG889_02045 [Streptomyces sp. NBC_00481]